MLCIIYYVKRMNPWKHDLAAVAIFFCLCQCNKLTIKILNAFQVQRDYNFVFTVHCSPPGMTKCDWNFLILSGIISMQLSRFASEWCVVSYQIISISTFWQSRKGEESNIHLDCIIRRMENEESITKWSEYEIQFRKSIFVSASYCDWLTSFGSINSLKIIHIFSISLTRLIFVTFVEFWSILNFASMKKFWIRWQFIFGMGANVIERKLISFE